jgi:hypothetical protein
MKFCTDSQYQKLLGNLKLIFIGPVKYMFYMRLQQIIVHYTVVDVKLCDLTFV